MPEYAIPCHLYLPPGSGPRNLRRDSRLGGRPTCDRKSIADVVNCNPSIACDRFRFIRFFPVFETKRRGYCGQSFQCALVCRNEKVLHSKTLLEHCILAEVGVCYRSVGEVETARAWGSLRYTNAKSESGCWLVGNRRFRVQAKWRSREFRFRSWQL